ncbi:MAG: site-specific integrase [Steroidobacteraceae bacterium]
MRFREEIADAQTGRSHRRQRREELGWFRSRSAAEKALDEYWTRLRATDLQSGPSVKLAAYWARYCEIHLPLLRESSQRAYKASLRHAMELLGPSSLHQVGPEEVQRLIGKMHEARLARATIRQAVVRLLSLLKRARREGFAVQTLSFRALSMPSERNARREPRAISAEELEQVLAASAPREQAMWALGALAGCRAGEIMALAWTDVDLERGVVRIRASATGGRIHAAKTAKSVRSIPMLPRLQQILSTYREACSGQSGQLLFATKGGQRPLDQSDVRKRIWHPLRKRLGIGPMSLHSLRHSLAARLASLGMGEAEAAAWLGHGNLRQTRAYTHLQEAQLLKSLSAALERTGGSGQ